AACWESRHWPCGHPQAELTRTITGSAIGAGTIVLTAPITSAGITTVRRRPTLIRRHRRTLTRRRIIQIPITGGRRRTTARPRPRITAEAWSWAHCDLDGGKRSSRGKRYED